MKSDEEILANAAKEVFDEMKKEQRIEGISPDAPIHRHESGGLESKPIGWLVRSFPARALLEVAKVIMHGGERYAPNNWRHIKREDHINHALLHIFAYNAGDDQDEHLEHATTRLLFALDMPDDRPYDKPELGCAKCATDWTDAVHDGSCELKGKKLYGLREYDVDPENVKGSETYLKDDKEYLPTSERDRS